jgi:hypothetical protein
MSGHIVAKIRFYEVPVCGKCRGNEDVDEYLKESDRLSMMSSVKIQCPQCKKSLVEAVLQEIEHNDFNEMGYLHGIETSLHQKLILMLDSIVDPIGDRKTYLKDVPAQLTVKGWYEKVKSKFTKQTDLNLHYNKYNFHIAISGWDVVKSSSGNNLLTDLVYGKFDTNFYQMEIPVEKGEPYTIYARIEVIGFFAPRSDEVVERMMSATYSEPESPKKVEKKTPLRRAVAVKFSPPKVVASLGARTVKVASPRAVVRPVSPRSVAGATTRPSSPRAVTVTATTVTATTVTVTAAAPPPIAIPGATTGRLETGATAGRLGSAVRPSAVRLNIVRPGAKK